MANATAATYNAEARRNGDGWTVLVEGLGGFAVRDLTEIESKGRRHIFGHTDNADIEIALEIHVVIPPDVEQRLELAEHLVEDAGEELAGAIGGLAEGGWIPADIRWVITHRVLALKMAPLTISHAELAESGLSEHPQVTGIRWSDHGFAETHKCRDCVEATRSEYVGLGEAGTTDLLYGEVVCDFCEVGHDDESPSHVTFGPDGTPRVT